MKKMILLFLGGFLSFAVFAQKQIDDPNVELRQVGSFHGIESANGIVVILVQGSEESVAVSANEVKYRDKIRTEVEDGILKIYYGNEDWKLWQAVNGRKLRAYVSVKNIDRIEVSSGSDVKIEGTIKANDLKMDASSGGSIKGRIEASNLKVDQSSGATIVLSGTVANKISLDGSSGSSFRGFELVADTCDIDVSSGSGIQITVNKDLTVEASSGGYVQYKGTALISKVHTDSGGSVVKK